MTDPHERLNEVTIWQSKGATNRWDNHAHFHGSIPHRWLLRTASPLLTSSDEDLLIETHRRIRRMVSEANQQERLQEGREALFHAYAARERAVAAIEHSKGVRATYRDALIEIAREAVQRGAEGLRLFISVCNAPDQFHQRVEGVLDALHDIGNIDLTVRVTLPRTRRIPSISDIQRSIRLIDESGQFVGLDVSGLDSQCPAMTTIHMVRQTSILRTELEQMCAHELNLSVHWGETKAPEGSSVTLGMLNGFRSAGVDSIGHGFMAWQPNLVSCECGQPSELRLLQGFILEYCPGIAQLYGGQRVLSEPEVLSLSGAQAIYWGSDSPGILEQSIH